MTLIMTLMIGLGPRGGDDMSGTTDWTAERRDRRGDGRGGSKRRETDRTGRPPRRGVGWGGEVGLPLLRLPPRGASGDFLGAMCRGDGDDFLMRRRSTRRRRMRGGGGGGRSLRRRVMRRTRRTLFEEEGDGGGVIMTVMRDVVMGRHRPPLPPPPLPSGRAPPPDSGGLAPSLELELTSPPSGEKRREEQRREEQSREEKRREEKQNCPRPAHRVGGHPEPPAEEGGREGGVLFGEGRAASGPTRRSTGAAWRITHRRELRDASPPEARGEAFSEKA